MTIILTVIFGGAFGFGSPNIMGQKFGAEYTSELQTDFKGGYDWFNLLKATAEIQINRDFTFEASTISTAKTAKKVLVEDLLTYSNIEAENIALTFARLGFGATLGDVELFAGINNVNEDYFTTDLTSFFINSSCGISPTISCNYDIANYPLASWCLHYKQSCGALSWQTSLYPGRGYSRIFGHDNLFTFNLKRDGIFSISSIDYNKNGINCILGIAMHYGVCIDNGMGEQGSETTSAPTKKSFSATPWLLGEFELPHNLGLLLHGSYSSVDYGCNGYAGVGLIYSGKRVMPGVSLNYASFTGLNEFAAEVSARLPLLKGKAYLQPAVHIIATERHRMKYIGALRFSLSI